MGSGLVTELLELRLRSRTPVQSSKEPIDLEGLRRRGEALARAALTEHAREQQLQPTVERVTVSEPPQHAGEVVASDVGYAVFISDHGEAGGGSGRQADRLVFGHGLRDFRVLPYPISRRSV
jgi:hypothetical protein